MVSMVAFLRPVSSMSSQPTQRVALPQASTSPPSRLWMRMKASAPLLRPFDGDHLVEADRVLLSERADGDRRKPHRPLARVEHDELVAEAVHLAEGDGAAAHGEQVRKPLEFGSYMADRAVKTPVAKRWHARRPSRSCSTSIDGGV